MNETSPTSASAARDGHRARRGGGWLDYLVTMVVALVIAVLVKTFLIQPFFIPSESMVPTLETNDKIIVSKLTPGVFDLERGDVIVFEDTEGWIPAREGEPLSLRARAQKVLSYVGLAPDPDQNHLVKRLIGLPGDHVVCAAKDGAMEVNGVTLEEPYINPETPACQTAFDVTVPADDVWVMGDNRYDSADSAYHYEISQGASGFVPESSITGKAEIIMWPISRWGGLGAGEDAFSGVPDPS